MLKEYGVKQGRTKCSGKLIIKWPKANVYFFECFTAALLGDVLKPGSEREGGREPNNSLPVTEIEKQHRYDNWIWFGWVIIRLYATAVVLRFEPCWWQVLGSLRSHRKAPAPHAAHCFCLFPLLVQAGGFGVGFFPLFSFPTPVFAGVVLKVTWSLPGQENRKSHQWSQRETLLHPSKLCAQPLSIPPLS